MYLRPILDHKRAQWAGDQSPVTAVERRVPSEPGRFRAALRGDRVAVIAEFKPRSPSKGELRRTTEAPTITRAYVEAGASAVSVLADDEFFGGSPELVAAVATDPAVTVPVLYKDFLVDPRQVSTAFASGADGVLVIVRALGDGELRDITEAAFALGLDPLHECFDETDVERSLNVDATIVGVNNRDLDTFRVDLGISARLRPLVPDSVVTVSESGLSGPDDVATIAGHGFDACLVGESLLTATDLRGHLAAMASVPRKAVVA
jgi:indole-3-glycerol phosphate synthase